MLRWRWIGHAISIRTVLQATVASIGRDGGPLATVSLALRGGGQLTALATRKRWTSFGLSAGDPVFALVKTVALDERPIAGVPPMPSISLLNDLRDDLRAARAGDWPAGKGVLSATIASAT